MPRSPIQGELKGALSDCGIDLLEWGTHVLARNAVWVGAYAELRELLIQAAPGDLVLAVAENLDEVEFAFAEGAGFRLDIVRSLLVHLGSDIKLGSEKNKGTTFYFDLPFVLGEKDEGADLAVRLEDEKDLTGKSVLLVEDNILNQKVAERFL